MVGVPSARMPRSTKQAFSRAVGKTFQIEAFDESGCAELALTGKVRFDTIWIEPFCVQRVVAQGSTVSCFNESWRFVAGSIGHAGRFDTLRNTAGRTIQRNLSSGCTASGSITAGTFLKGDEKSMELSTRRTTR